MTAQDLIDTLLALTEGDVDAAIAALEDGAALLALGVTDQELVEEAHEKLSVRI